MCEKSISAMTVLGCPYGYIRYHEACFKKEFGGIDWYQARDMCADFGAEMAAPNSEHQLVKLPNGDTILVFDFRIRLFAQMFLTAFGNGEDLWLGSSDEFHEALWINVDRSEYMVEWLPSQPDNFDGENCMSLGSQQLDYGPVDNQCSQAGIGTICKHYMKKEDSLCPFGWQREAESCYHQGESQFNGSWFDAAVRCHFHGGFLASVNTPSELVINHL